MPNKEVISTQNDVERLEIREQTKSKSEAKWKYKVRCMPVGVHVYAPVCLHVHTRVCMCTYAGMHVCACVHLCVCMHMWVSESTFRERCIYERWCVGAFVGLVV